MQSTSNSAVELKTKLKEQPQKIIILKQPKKKKISMKQAKHLNYYYFLCRCMCPHKRHFQKECLVFS